MQLGLIGAASFFQVSLARVSPLYLSSCGGAFLAEGRNAGASVKVATLELGGGFQVV